MNIETGNLREIRDELELLANEVMIEGTPEQVERVSSAVRERHEREAIAKRRAANKRSRKSRRSRRRR